MTEFEAPSGSVRAPDHPDELRRIRTLCSIGILDTSPNERFDRVTRLAARLFDVPIALVSLVDADRQWFKSRVGLDAEETGREESFCAHSILGESLMVVPDAELDPRFQSNPLVTSAPNIRFYAGCPIRSADNLPLGTLCIIDHRPRSFAEEELAALADLAGIAEREIHALAISTRDELSGLTNRRGLDAIAHHVLGFCGRLMQPATLLVFDLDGFKAVNDSLGHAAGDRVIQGFSQALLSTFRDSDVVCRLGGDEFCVLMSGATTRDATGRLPELRAAMARCVGPRLVDFSVGIASSPTDGRGALSELLESADQRMYLDKDSRREGVRSSAV